MPASNTSNIAILACQSRQVELRLPVVGRRGFVLSNHTHTHTHTHSYMYMYAYLELISLSLGKILRPCENPSVFVGHVPVGRWVMFLVSMWAGGSCLNCSSTNTISYSLVSE